MAWWDTVPSDVDKRELRRKRAFYANLPEGVIGPDIAKSAASGVRSGLESALGLGDISTMQQALAQRAAEKFGINPETAATVAKYTSPFSLLPTSEDVGAASDRLFGRDEVTRHTPVTPIGETVATGANIASGLVGGPEDALKVAATSGPAKAMILGLGSRWFKSEAGKEALKTAKKMASEGASREAILKQTGLQQQHGDWTREISDKPMQLNDAAREALIVGGGYEGPLGPSNQLELFGHPPKPGLIEHPELFAEHPEMAEVPVKARLTFGERGGSYTPPAALPGEPEHIKAIGRHSEEVADVVAHEVQHLAQNLSELPHGGSPRDRTLQQPMQQVKARAKQHFSRINNELLAFQQANAGGDYTKYPALAREWRAANPEKAKLMDSSLDVLATGAGPHMGYHHLAGEVQARNAARRREMTAAERVETPTWETQEVPDELQIVRRRPGREQLVQEMATPPRKPPTKGKKPVETDVYDPWSVRTPIENKPTRSGAFDYDAPPAAYTESAPTYVPKHGVPERSRDLLSRRDVQDKMLEGIERGRPLKGWYETGPLKQAFIDVLGHNEGPVRFAEFIRAVGATSPRSKVGENIRNASYYYGLGMRGEKLPAKNPYPYGHIAQGLHRGNIGKVLPLGGSNQPLIGFDPTKNPKPIGFIANLLGDPNRVTVDTHAFRAPAMLGQDTRFLETGLQTDKGGPIRNIMREYEQGKISLEDALKQGSYWQTKPRENEYGAWQDYYRELARQAGMTPREAQAASWTGFGEMTGLESSPEKTFMDFMEDRLLKTQAERDTRLSPREILTNMILGKKGKALLSPLLAAPVAGAAMLGPDRDEGGGNAL